MVAQIVVQDLILGPAELYVGAFGAVEPTTADDDIDPLVWKPAGGTQEGIRQVIQQTYTDLVVDEIAMPADAQLTQQAASIATALAEGRLDNWRYALNQPDSTATKLGISGNITNSRPTFRSIMAKGLGPEGLPRLVIMRRALSKENIEAAYSKANQTFIPITWAGYYVSPSIDALVIDDTQTP